MIGFNTKVLQLKTERLEEDRAGKMPFPSLRLNDDTVIDFFPKKLWQSTASSVPGRENLNHFCLALHFSDREGDMVEDRYYQASPGGKSFFSGHSPRGRATPYVRVKQGSLHAGILLIIYSLGSIVVVKLTACVQAF
jgi:hypothetical protein